MGFWGKFLDFMEGGLPIVFENGTGPIVECMKFEVNNSSRKVRLFLAFTEGHSKQQTGFIYDMEDFTPSPEKWKNYSGTIKCTRSIDGKKDFKDMDVKQYIEKITTLKKHNDILKKSAIELLEVLEKKKVTEKRKEETFEMAKALNAIKKLTQTSEEEDSKGSGIPPNLFNFG